jgi:hypothetical protein
MRVARYSEVPWTRSIGLRGGGNYEDPSIPDDEKPGSRYKRYFKGTPGVPGHFEAVILAGKWSETSDAGTGRSYPRHRHNFDQLRYTISGSPEIMPGHPCPAGSLVYTAAGTYYGPYDRHAGEMQLHVQFEGANGAPFVDYDALIEARDRLVRKGRFESGQYFWTDENGQERSMDGHQAGMEAATGQKEEFPAPRYTSSIQMDPANFNWEEVQPGVKLKELAAFTERETLLVMLRLEGNVSHTISSPDRVTLMLVTSGAGAADGQAVEERDGLMLAKDEHGVVSTTSQLELLLLGLPKPATVNAATSTKEPALARV